MSLESCIQSGLSANVGFDHHDLVLSFEALRGCTLVARTSGTLLVCGVGGYCVYRMWVRLFGNNFMCTLLDSANLGRVPRADVRMFSRGCSPVHIISKELGAHLMREARQGFACLPLSSSTPKKARKFRSDDSVSIRSDLTSVSRQRPVRSRQQHVRTISCCSRASGSQSVVAPSECSTSLRLMWDGDQMWEDEFAEKEGRYGPDVGAKSKTEGSPSTLGTLIFIIYDIFWLFQLRGGRHQSLDLSE
uniref:Fibroblast growth factor n=1 Tax=Steinernema glaseri TaxID=37863 RepID=A0A1I8AS72_9BILA